MSAPVRRRPGGRRAITAGICLAAVLAVGGCGYDDTALPRPEASAAASGTPAAAPTCDPAGATRSYAPSRDAGPAVKRIRERGRLIAGVSADSLLLGANDPFTNRIEGFDIDVAQAIADALGVELQLRVISAAQRIPLLQSGEIDIVARNMTVNCSRWEQIAFSAVYYNASQQVLVRRDDAASYAGPSSLAGKKVCAPTGSTSLDNIVRIEPEAVAVPAANHTGCLVRFQQGQVDAITGDDTVLAGLAAQDPYARVPKQEPLTREPYGIGVNKDDVDLVRFINAVLEQRRSDGAWARSFARWLAPDLPEVDATPPVAEYGR